MIVLEKLQDTKLTLAMISVTITTPHGRFKKLEIKGHAGYAEYGKDIVCAGVSSIVGGINALERPEAFRIVCEDGNVEIEKINNIPKHDSIVLSTMITQLKTVAESYGNYIQIKKGI